MTLAIEVPVHHARSLQLTLDALCGESAALKAADLMAVTVGELLDGADTVNQWIADLEVCTDAAIGQSVVLPVRDPATLQHIVYCMSAVLVWADEMRRAGRIMTTLSAEALTAWNEVEKACGLGGRTASAITDRRVVAPLSNVRPLHTGVDLLQVIHLDAA